LNDYKVLAHVASEIHKLRQEQAAFLAAGRADNHPEYKHVCGIIRGLNYAESIINDLVQRMEKNDD
jgi:hypothetical protein